MFFLLVYAYQDGMNCLLAPSPFPPVTTTTSTTSGGERGDPHINTLGGEHYLLLGQGPGSTPHRCCLGWVKKWTIIFSKSLCLFGPSEMSPSSIFFEFHCVSHLRHPMIHALCRSTLGENYWLGRKAKVIDKIEGFFTPDLRILTSRYGLMMKALVTF